MRLPALIVVFLALTWAPAATAGNSDLERALAEGGEFLSLDRGRGVAIVNGREGTMLGKVRRGAIRVVRPRGSDTEVGVYGCERRRNSGRAVFCAGRYLRFELLGGSWHMTARGAGINASAVLRGSVTLRGRAGTYEIGDGDPRPWPRRARTFGLG